MDAPSVLWMNWQEQLNELLTGMHGHQKKTLAFFVLGIVLSGCAVMQRVAETLYERGLSEAKMSSIERRLARFIANERIVGALSNDFDTVACRKNDSLIHLVPPHKRRQSSP